MQWCVFACWGHLNLHDMFCEISIEKHPQAPSLMGRTRAQATIHVIKRDGTIVKGLDGVRVLYDAVGLGWVMQLAKLPVLGEFAEMIYKIISKNRMAIGGGMDAGEHPGLCETTAHLGGSPSPVLFPSLSPSFLPHASSPPPISRALPSRVLHLSSQ